MVLDRGLKWTESLGLGGGSAVWGFCFGVFNCAVPRQKRVSARNLNVDYNCTVFFILFIRPCALYIKEKQFVCVLLLRL